MVYIGSWYSFFFPFLPLCMVRTSTESPVPVGLNSLIDEISPREIDASKYRFWTRFDASHDARPGIAFSHSSLPVFFLSTSLPIPFHDSLSGFWHRPRHCRFFYGTSSRLSSPFARVLTVARVILPRGQCVTYNWKSQD